VRSHNKSRTIGEERQGTVGSGGFSFDCYEGRKEKEHLTMQKDTRKDGYSNSTLKRKYREYVPWIGGAEFWNRCNGETDKTHD